ncbi:glycosyltransferase [Marinobacter sp. HL-58]|uniref:glycosyltransferase n=1 Tax=Marinobacter sp. HL-58 TaxID=1479237 RepID=UPI0006D9AFF6|nr:glycosyltransferase [Marinobacter sp. HL-58]KPQ02364.1 MAG: Glycosyltransferase [Marinobacter sp. HL-58]
MNIIIVTHVYPDKADAQAGIFVHRQVKELERLGHNAQVIRLVPSFFLRYSKKERDYIHEGVKVTCVKYFKIPSRYFYSLSTLIAGVVCLIDSRVRSINNVDLVYSQWSLPGGFVGFCISKLKRVKSFVCVRGSDINCFSKNDFLARIINRAALSSSSHVFSVSELLMKEAKKCAGLRDDLVSVNYNGVDSEVFFPPLLRPFSTPSFLFVGNLKKEKGVFELLRLFELIKACFPIATLTVVGKGALESKLKSFSVERKLDVNFVGSQKADKVALLMRECNYFIFLSKSEGLPNVVLEALASGMIVFSTPVGGVPEVVFHGVNGFHISDIDLNASRDVIKEVLLMSPDHLSRISDKASVTVVEKFNWKSNVRYLTEVFNECQ